MKKQTYIAITFGQNLSIIDYDQFHGTQKDVDEVYEESLNNPRLDEHVVIYTRDNLLLFIDNLNKIVDGAGKHLLNNVQAETHEV